MKRTKEKILVCLSGGVDSSVAAGLLVRQGYDVTAAYMKQFSEDTTPSGSPLVRGRDKTTLQTLVLSGVEGKEGLGEGKGVCTWKTDRRDALRVAAHLGIDMLTLDFEDDYRAQVLDYMYAEYQAGRTPNPDVLCNKYVKFDAWLHVAKELGFEKIATGHYGHIRITDDSDMRIEDKKDGNEKTFRLMVPEDKDKDQTYFLHQLSQEQLAHILFPLGEYEKSEVRDMAKKWQLPTAARAESMGICFVGEVPMKDFLQEKIKKKKGKIVLSDGTVVGDHDGLAFYTIGQRAGLSVPSSLITKRSRSEKEKDNEPLYVLAKNDKKNELIVGFDDDPLRSQVKVPLTQMHFISGEEPTLPLSCHVRLRHRQELQRAVLVRTEGTYEAGEGYMLEFQTAQKAVTPGQFAVLYKKDECLGGGVVKCSFTLDEQVKSG